MNTKYMWACLKKISRKFEPKQCYIELSAVKIPENVLTFLLPYIIYSTILEICADFSLILHFIYLGFYVSFNTVQVISRWVVGRAEETST